ncbi:MAG: ATP-binding protein [Bacteroidales bacterium]|nr:ATP-binding protein [Lachnoclostridium sp.]MCM1384775.1 ATP-binding protein [Lachnoclostridium sp.]MCM1465081.1 ATP-binding protein [Bacteroidales bacterium]
MIEIVKQKLRSLVFLRSLRARIFVIVLTVGIVPSIWMRYGIVNNYENRAVDQRVATVQNQLKIIANHLVNNNYLTTYRSDEQAYRNSKAVINAELEMLSNLYEGRVMIINSNFKVIKDTYGISEGKTIISEEVIKCFQGENISHYDPEHGYIEMTIPITGTLSGEDGTDPVSVVMGVMLTSISNESIVTTMNLLNRNSLILETIMIIAIFGLAMVLSVVLTRPFNRVTDAINKVRAGYSDESISVSDYAETEHIVEAFNQMLKRMKTLDDSRQEFVANVSHELKTPMTSMKVLADSLLSQEGVPAELYREFMEDIVSEVDRENQIITDLLALVKMDKKVQALNIVSLNINELTELILKRLRPIARKKDVEVVFESVRPVVAEVDEVKMSMIITNLVENAIKYNKEHGWVKVVLDADHQFFTLEVSDSGIGIPEDSLAYIYERFYRVDKSHSRKIGGTGLGLAITRSAVLMHRGSITVTSTEGQGSCFTVKISLNYIA